MNSVCVSQSQKFHSDWSSGSPPSSARSSSIRTQFFDSALEATQSDVKRLVFFYTDGCHYVMLSKMCCRQSRGEIEPHMPRSAVFPVLTSIGRRGTARIARDYILNSANGNSPQGELAPGRGQTPIPINRAVRASGRNPMQPAGPGRAPLRKQMRSPRPTGSYSRPAIRSHRPPHQ